MRKALSWIGNVTFISALVFALAFGVQQGFSTPDPTMLCEGTCPNERLCNQCCIDEGGTFGECSADGTECICGI